MIDKVEALVKCAQEKTEKGKVRNYLLILDDVMYDKAICRTPCFRNLFYNGRHYKITCILLLQYLVDLPPDLRAQIDYVFTCREPILANKMKLYKMFFGVFTSFEDFAQVLERCTQNYEVLCLDNTSSSTNAGECAFWYKASVDLAAFHLCRDSLYQLADRFRKDPDSSFSEEESALVKKGRLQITKEDEAVDVCER